MRPSLTAVLSLGVIFAAPSIASAPATVAAPAALALGPVADQSMSTFVGRARLVRLPYPVSRVAIGDESIADFRLVSPRELYLLGKSVGVTNLILWHRDGRSSVVEANVSIDLDPVARMLKESLPRETGIELSSSGASIVLGGSVSDGLAAEAAVHLVDAYAANLNRYLQKQGGGSGGGSSAQQGDKQASTALVTVTGSNLVRVINLLKIRDAQQVMLEVRIAEVSKKLTDQLGLKVAGSGGGGVSWNVGSNFLGGGSGAAGILFDVDGSSFKIDLDAERKNGLVKILAEPTIVAMSGQEGSFLVGGKIYIPVAQAVGGSAGTAVTLEEREFGVGLKFVPTVLDNGRISLKVAPEVSELSKEPVAFAAGGSGSILPAFTTTKVATTVQLREGQSLVIGGLLRNNLSQTVKAFPVLGEIPILGALFRSSQYSSDRSELVVVVRPTLVSATDERPKLPTDNFVPPSRSELFLEGKMEGRAGKPSSEVVK